MAGGDLYKLLEMGLGGIKKRSQQGCHYKDGDETEE